MDPINWSLMDCIECGKTFEDEHGYGEWCSEECGSEYFR